MSDCSSLSYLLAIALKELFPATEIRQIHATTENFYCDFTFDGEFTTQVMSLLEERMRVWVKKEEPFQLLNMMPANAAQMLEHHGDKKFAQLIRKQEGLVALLKLDRFFFQIEGETPATSADIPYFKLVKFWTLPQGLRLVGAGADNKDLLKERAARLKLYEDVQKKLESHQLVSWLEGDLIWESKAEIFKDLIYRQICTLYEGFDHVLLPESPHLKKILLQWTHERKRPGFQFRKKNLTSGSQEPWDSPQSWGDESWGRADEINSFLHLITKFLTIFSFDYEVVSVGKIDPNLEKSLKAHFVTWNSERGTPSRLEVHVKDRLGRKWVLSTMELDLKNDLVQMTLCSSFERCVALVVDADNFETLLNRLKKLENQ